MSQPHELYEQTGGGDAYRVAMLEHGHVYPTAPDERKSADKRAEPCGLLHLSDWSEWRPYTSQRGRDYEGRWCRVCAHTNVRWVDA